MTFSIVSAPTTAPVSLAEAKLHLRVDASDDDTLIAAIVDAATVYCENIARRSFVTQTIDVAYDAWPSADGFYLPRIPVQSVTSITYTDEDGSASTVSSNDYIVDTYNGRIALKASATWPSVTLQKINGVVIRYVAGYGAANDVPEQIKQAIKLVIGDWYEVRENMITGTITSTVDFGVRALIQSVRNYPR